MYGKTIGTAAVMLAAIAIASPASAEKMTMKLNLTGASEVPPNDSAAKAPPMSLMTPPPKC